MFTCPNCGAYDPNRVRYCSRCGHLLSEPPAAPVPPLYVGSPFAYAPPPDAVQQALGLLLNLWGRLSPDEHTTILSLLAAGVGGSARSHAETETVVGRPVPLRRQKIPITSEGGRKPDVWQTC